MKTTQHISVELTDEETQKVLEGYARMKLWAQHGINSADYKLDDIDTSIDAKNKRGAYLFFLKECDTKEE